jgi:glutamate 5-kinase
VNENDSIGVEEIRFGENDKLGAQIAMMVNADVYIILTDVDGLFDRNPHTHDNARHISDVSHISRDMYDCAGYQRNELSVGGMKTKIEAAEMVTKAGIYAIIGNGYSRGLLESITDPEAATLFHPSQKKMKSRERWLAFSGKIQGTLWIDAGAADALRHRGKSLLPAGISKTEGTYKPGDAVEVRCTKTGERIARGFTNYGNEDVDRIKGEKSAAVASILGEKTFNVVVHRNNMVLVC